MKIGIVGLGYWGSKVVGEYISLRDESQIDSVVACDTYQERLANISSVDEKYDSLENCINNVDALHVCTPNRTHREIATRALNNKVDVLIEKPLTIDRESAYDLVELASETGRILQTGHIFRFANVVRRVRELYEEGYFGTVYDISLSWTHWMDSPTPTNVLWDLMPHPIDIVNFITSEWPEDPIGVSSSHRTNVGESAKIQMQINEIDLSIYVSWNDRIRRRLLEIAGSDRSAQIKCVGQNMTVFNDDGMKDSISVKENNTIRAEAENFIQSIDTGKNTFNSAIVGARTVDKINEIEDAIFDE